VMAEHKQVKALSYGAGVDSTAILALIKLGKLEGIECAVFADTGAEQPETYAYLEYIKLLSPIPIITISAKQGSLLKFCEERKILPSRAFRWCTDKWKHRPLAKYAKEHDIGEWVIGIDAGEEKRVLRWKSKEGFSFPLINMGFDREACQAVILDAGWKLPIKSGCVFCPFTRMGEWGRLAREHPERFKEVCIMEMEALKTRPHLKGLFGSRPLAEMVARKFPDTVEGQQCIYCEVD